MRAWKQKARWEVTKTTYGSDPDAVPEYRIPKPKPWWALWRPVEWETVRGVSRTQMERAQAAQENYYRARLKRANELGITSPYFNLNSPLLDPPE